MKKIFNCLSLLIVVAWTTLLGLWNIGASGGYSFFTSIFDYITKQSSYLTLGVLNAATIGLWALIFLIICISIVKSRSSQNKGVKVLFSIILMVWLALVVALNIDGSFPTKYSWLKWVAPLGVQNTLLWINIITDGGLIILGTINFFKQLTSDTKKP